MVGGAITSFRMEGVVIGVDDDGDALTAGIVSAEPVAGTAASAKASARQDISLNALDCAMRDHSQEPPIGVEAPARVVSVDKWKAELHRLGVLIRDPDPASSKGRVAFKRLKDGLTAAGLIGESCGWVWPSHGGVGYPHNPSPVTVTPLQPYRVV
jgi:hypothetical protein